MKKLLNKIEEAARIQPTIPSEFDVLSNVVWKRTGEYLSSTTLKRLWGYNKEEVKPRKSTLNILARFIGYKDFEDYLERQNEVTEADSHPVVSKRLDVAKDIKPGDLVYLYWNPDRLCRTEYLGDFKFRVLYSEKTRLQAGNTFTCSLIVYDEPLFINNLDQGLKETTGYVCGKKGGVRYTVVPESEKTADGLIKN